MKRKINTKIIITTSLLAIIIIGILVFASTLSGSSQADSSLSVGAARIISRSVGTRELSIRHSERDDPHARNPFIPLANAKRRTRLEMQRSPAAASDAGLWHVRYHTTASLSLPEPTHLELWIDDAPRQVFLRDNSIRLAALFTLADSVLFEQLAVANHQITINLYTKHRLHDTFHLTGDNLIKFTQEMRRLLDDDLWQEELPQ